MEYYTYGGRFILRNVAERFCKITMTNSFINAPLANFNSMQTSNTSFSHTQNFSIGAFGGGIILSESMGGVISSIVGLVITQVYTTICFN